MLSVIKLFVSIIREPEKLDVIRFASAVLFLVC